MAATATDGLLVSTDWLADHLDDPSVRIVEISFAEDSATYDAGHIPGAVWWYWKAALWDEADREFATTEQIAERLASIGVNPQMTIVLYGDPVQFGTYAFWVLTMTGHPDVRLLDGSRTKWAAEGRPMVTEPPNWSSAPYAVQTPNPSSRVGRDDVRAHLDDASRLLLDVRSPEEYDGQRVSPPSGFDHGAERKGRIPGSAPFFFRDVFNDDDTYKSIEQLRALCADHPNAPHTAAEIVTYCRLSHRATAVWFALTFLMGHDNVKIYDGSWTEWGSIVGFPIER